MQSIYYNVYGVLYMIIFHLYIFLAMQFFRYRCTILYVYICTLVGNFNRTTIITMRAYKIPPNIVRGQRKHVLNIICLAPYMVFVASVSTIVGCSRAHLRFNPFLLCHNRYTTFATLDHLFKRRRNSLKHHYSFKLSVSGP